MRQIADMGARALDDLAIGLDQRVGLARERSDLDREFALQALGMAGPDRGKTFGNTLERRKAEAHLQDNGYEQRGGEPGKDRADDAVEAQHLVLDLRGIARDRDQVTAVVAEIDGALDQPQPHILRTRRITLPVAPDAAARRSLQMRQVGIPQRARGMHFRLLGIEPRHLPVPARQRQLEQRLADRLREFVAAPPPARRRRRPACAGMPWNDETAIGQAFLRLFRDPDLRGRMGRDARRRVVENYSTVRVAETYEALFETALNAAPRQLS